MEHLGAALDVKFANVINAVSECDQRGNDSACACPRNVVEVFGKNEIWTLAARSKLIFDFRKDFNAYDPANAPAIAGKQLSGAEFLKSSSR